MSEIAKQAKAGFAGQPIRVQDHETPIVAPADGATITGARYETRTAGFRGCSRAHRQWA